MTHVNIAIRLESLGLPLRRALAEAARLGVAGVQFDAAGDLAPTQLSQTGRRELRHLLRSHNLELIALGCPLRHGLDVAENQQPRIEHVRAVMTLSFDLGPRVVLIQAGQVTADKDAPPSPLLREALLSLGQHGDRTGTRLALTTGLEPGSVLASFLDTFDTGGLAVNLSPALLLVHGFNVYDSTRALSRYIVHVSARDARQSGGGRLAQEVPLGHGDIDWMQYLGVLEEVEYRGWITVERDSGDNRLADVSNGVGFLRRLVG
jgi:sugar phosphate isomerase/epimerase